MSRDQDLAAYWEARARELQERLDVSRRRLRALVNALPDEALDFLEMDVELLEATAWAESPITGIQTTWTFVPSDVASELSVVWQRLAR